MTESNLISSILDSNATSFSYYLKIVVGLVFRSPQLHFGSGVLISSNIILTSIDNVFDWETKSVRTNLTVYPGMNGEVK
jgi:hypothetical protein